MFSLRILTGIITAPALPSSSSTTSRCSSSSVAHSLSPHPTAAAATLKIPCNLEPLESKIGNLTEKKKKDIVPPRDNLEDDYNHEEEDGLSRIQVPRQKYIPVPKSELLNGIVSTLFDSLNDDINPFLLLSSCLDSILHAEHKIILEQMRTDYFSTQSIDDDEVTSNGKSATPGREADSDKVVASEEKSEPVGDSVTETGLVREYGEEYNGPDKLPLPFNYDLDLRGLAWI